MSSRMKRGRRSSPSSFENLPEDVLSKIIAFVTDAIPISATCRSARHVVGNLPAAHLTWKHMMRICDPAGALLALGGTEAQSCDAATALCDPPTHFALLRALASRDCRGCGVVTRWVHWCAPTASALSSLPLGRRCPSCQATRPWGGRLRSAAGAAAARGPFLADPLSG